MSSSVGGNVRAPVSHRSRLLGRNGSVGGNVRAPVSHRSRLLGRNVTQTGSFDGHS